MGDHFEFPGDDRAVSTVIGFIMIFAMLIILLSTYQAVWVPIQNEQVEFDHYQTVSDDMTDARSAIFEARTNGETQSTTVKLGTRYPNRLIAVNPAPATGTLETGARRNISMTNQADGTPIDMAARYPGINSEGEIYTQFLSYTPNYNVLDTGAPIRHEHGLLYKDFNETGQGGGLVIQNDGQTLVQTNEDGPNDLTLVPIQGNYSEQGTERVSLDPEPGILVSREFTDVNVTVPTDLRESTWEDILSDDLAPEKVVVNKSTGELTLVLDGVWTVEYAPIGVDGTPVSGARGEGGTAINPASPGDIRLVSSERLDGQQNAWRATFNNTGGSTNFTEARISFYSSSQQPTSTLHSIVFPDGSNQDLLNLNWGIGDSFAQLEPEILMEGNNTETQMRFNFDDVHSQDTFFVVEFIFESGERGTYFVGENPEETNGETGGDTGGGTGPTVTDVSTDTYNSQGDWFLDVSWTVEEQGDSELDEVTVQVSGDVQDTKTVSVDGTTASGTTQFDSPGNNPTGTYNVTVSNVDGEQASQGGTY